MYYIYHIKGKKIGCTNNPEDRIKSQGFKDWEILEKHTDIFIASHREQELQKQYGYQIDKVPYYKVISTQTYEQKIKQLESIKGLGGKKCVESGQLASIRNKQNQSKGGSISGKKHAESGHLKSICKLGGFSSISKRYICPHCGKEGQHRAMQLWHGDRCKLSPAT